MNAQQSNTQAKQDNHTHIAIVMPLTVPSSGKSTIFRLIKDNITNINIEVISSDGIRSKHMAKMMAQYANISKKQAYDKTKQSATNEYYRTIQQTITNMQKGTTITNSLILLDKNYSLCTLPDALQQIHNIISHTNTNTNAKTKTKTKTQIDVVGLLPNCQQHIVLKCGYAYPFSACFVANCVKRIIRRANHQVLEGSQGYRAAVCLGWANNLRNFYQSQQSKVFKSYVHLPLTKDQPVPYEIKELIYKILQQTKMNSFQQHPLIQQLIEKIRKWDCQEVPPTDKLAQIKQEVNKIFL